MFILWNIVLLILSHDKIFALEPNGPDWNYQESESWSETYPQCAGFRQSPIDISRENIYLATRAPMINFTDMDTVPKSSKLCNDGHKLKVEYEWDDVVPTVSGGPLDSDYELQKMVIHWPSTHTFSNETADLGIQLSFRNTKYTTDDEAIKDSNGFVVVVLLFEIGDECPLLKSILDNSTEVLSNINGSTLVPPFSVDKFSPKKPNKQYMVYEGSWDQPPCPESNIWMISTNPHTVSQKQVDTIRKTALYNDDKTNTRPPQPLNGRRVYMFRGNK